METPISANLSAGETQGVQGNNQIIREKSKSMNSQLSSVPEESYSNGSAEREELNGASSENGDRHDPRCSIPEIHLPDEKDSEDSKGISNEELSRGEIGVNRLLGSVSSFVVHDMLSTTNRITTVSDEGTSEVEVPLLFSLVYKTRPFLKEFLFELCHISECVMANDVCHFSWCKELKKDIYHVSICTNVKCKLCTMVRPLILIHSLQCTKLQCSIPFCEVLLSLSIPFSAIATPGASSS